MFKTPSSEKAPTLPGLTGMLDTFKQPLKCVGVEAKVSKPSRRRGIRKSQAAVEGALIQDLSLQGGSPSQKPPLQPPCSPSLATQTKQNLAKKL